MAVGRSRFAGRWFEDGRTLALSWAGGGSGGGPGDCTAEEYPKMQKDPKALSAKCTACIAAAGDKPMGCFPQGACHAACGLAVGGRGREIERARERQRGAGADPSTFAE